MRPARIEEDTEGWATLLYEPFIKLATSHLGTSSRVPYLGSDLKVSWKRVEQAITGYYGTFVLK